MHVAGGCLSLLFLVLLPCSYERETIGAEQETGPPIEVPFLVGQSRYAHLLALRRAPFRVLRRERRRIVGGQGRAPRHHCRQPTSCCSRRSCHSHHRDRKRCPSRHRRFWRSQKQQDCYRATSVVAAVGDMQGAGTAGLLPQRRYRRQDSRSPWTIPANPSSKRERFAPCCGDADPLL